MGTLEKTLAAFVALGIAVAATCFAAEDTDGATTENARRAFTAGTAGEFHFDTGVLRGKLRAGGKSVGLSSVVHIPSGIRLDRSMGLFSHYRVFTTNKRYGTAAWDWPSTARLRDDGAVEVIWAADTNRPFELRAVYRVSAPDAVDLDTTVEARQDLANFESFLASYFADRFTNSLVSVSSPRTIVGAPGFHAAEKALGVWQMFPRDDAAPLVINDGRWALEPHPVQWTLMRTFAWPVGVRRDPASGVSAVLIARPQDCFALATPYQTEGHYSFYLSLFGRTVKAGETARARTRLVVMSLFEEGRILERTRF